MINRCKNAGDTFVEGGVWCDVRHEVCPYLSDTKSMQVECGDFSCIRYCFGVCRW